MECESSHNISFSIYISKLIVIIRVFQVGASKSNNLFEAIIQP